MPPQPLPWYPAKLAWQLAFTRNQLRKLPVLWEIHELLKRENDAGSITRQEAVSMVPPLLLDVQPEHKVACPRCPCCYVAKFFVISLPGWELGGCLCQDHIEKVAASRVTFGHAYTGICMCAILGKCLDLTDLAAALT